MNKRLALSFGLLAGALCMRSQTSPPASPTADVKSTSEEVVVDVVVRDKKGRAVTDLAAGDFSVSDNGAPKPIKTFRLVQGTEAVGASGTRTQLDPLRQLRLVTFIFDNLDVNARQLARSAAYELLKAELPQNVYMAVMTIDHKLEALQPFTNDRDLLHKAIERATSRENADYSADTAAVQKQLESMVGPNADSRSDAQRINDSPTGATSVNGPGAAPSGAAMANQLMATMMLRMIQGEQSMAMTLAGRAQIYALLDAIKDQYRLPGRKTVLYFSEGLQKPQGTEAAFDSMTAMANRNNVSIYCIDARGLTIDSTNRAAMNALNDAANASQHRQTNPNSAVSSQEARMTDTAIDSTRANVQENLASLAEATGGTLIANTNDFRSPIRKIGEDIETYYELSYNPEITNYDGSLHKIAVHTTQKDLRLQSRSGYYAFPASLAASSPVHPYDVPLLKALDETPVPHGFDFHATGAHFRGAGSKTLCDLIIDIPLANLTLTENKEKKTFAGDFAYVAIIKDQQGSVVRKFDNEIPLNVPAEKLAAVTSSHFIYTEHFELPAGRYHLETAVLDKQGDKVSARKAVLIIPAAGSVLAVSSVVAVRSMKPKSADVADNDPLIVSGNAITPALDPIVSKKANSGLPFYLEIYPDKSNASKPELIMNFSKDGQALGSGKTQLGDPDAQGRIQYVASTPVAQLETGAYQVMFVVKQGAESISEIVGFTIVQ